MTRIQTLAFSSLTILGIAGLSALLSPHAVAQVSGSVPAYIKLQSSAPGTAQTGNGNIDGNFSVTRLTVGGGLADAFNPILLNSQGGVIVNSFAGNGVQAFCRAPGPTPAVAGVVPIDGYSGNAGIYGVNQITGAQGLLGFGNYGVYGSSSSGDAGYFSGNVTATGFLSANAVIAHNGLVMDNANGDKVYLSQAGSNSNGFGLQSSLLQIHTDSSTADIAFGFGSSSSMFETMRIKGNGRVGINISAPTALLDSRSAAATGTLPAFYGQTNSTSASASAIYGVVASNSAGSNSVAVRGQNNGTSGGGIGVWGSHSGGGWGMYGSSIDGYGVYGVGSGSSSLNIGVIGLSNSASGYGVYSQGRFGASGTKSFRIDHPLDPENKYLMHYCAEGPEPENIYNGTVRTDSKGEAWVQLPDYYASINKDPRYQLTVIDGNAGPGFVMVKVAKEIEGNRFMIMTSAPNIKVSWEVKAVRNDRFVQKYGAPVEQAKPAAEVGTYQRPELYGFGPERGTQAKQLNKVLN